MEIKPMTIERVQELLETYESAGLSDISTRFLRKVIEEKQIPDGTRGKWLEDLFRREGSLKQARDLIQLAAKSRRNDIADTLRDYARMLSKGRELSDRQKKMIEALRQQMASDSPDRDLTDRDRHLLRGLHGSKQSNATYWLNRPIVSKRLDEIFRRFYVDGTIACDDWKYIRSTFRGKADSFESFHRKHPTGSLRWAPRFDSFSSDRWIPVIVIGDCGFSSDGRIVTRVMSRGDVRLINIEALRVNKPK